ncbi:MAG: hypothetical protein K2Q26_13515 [Bdellovibrionales bacterium]|nr:hypothetical protein [Bdellovibrionales bacterium]
MISKYVIITFAALALFSQGLFANGVEAIQLEHVAIDTSLGCDREFFRSSQGAQGIIYVLPYVMIDVDETGENIFSIREVKEWRENKNHLLSVQLYFPYDEADIKSKVHLDEMGSVQTCNFTAVKNFLNAKEKDPAKRVHTISPIPLTYIEVSIPEYISAVSRVGSTNVEANDVVDYLGKPRVFNLPMTKEEYHSVVGALQSRVGLQARVKFHFKARQNNGAVRITVNRQQLAVNFQLAAKGEKYIARADLDVALRTSMEKSGVTIETQAGNNSELFDKVATQIIEKVVSQIDLSITEQAKPNSATCEAPEGKVCVSTVLGIISQRIDQTISYNNSTAPEAATAESVVDLNLLRLEDPRLEVIRVISGEPDPVLSRPILAGETVRIRPGYYSIVTRRYQKSFSYLTADEIAKEKYATHFLNYLSSRWFKVEDETRNHRAMAVGKFAIGGLAVGSLYQEYYWKRTIQKPVIVSNPRASLKETEFDRFPIEVSFSLHGNDRRSYEFRQLVGDKPDWRAEFDSSGVLVLTAKKDLGFMKLRERFRAVTQERKNELIEKLKAEGKSLNEDLYYLRKPTEIETITMEARRIWDSAPVVVGSPVVVRSNPRAATVLKVVNFYVTTPTREETSTTADPASVAPPPAPLPEKPQENPQILPIPVPEEIAPPH